MWVDAMSACAECVFVEEQEPSGRLVLPPCIVCGRTAMDAVEVLVSARVPPMATAQVMLEKLIEALAENDHEAYGGLYLDASDPTDAIIDGHVDLAAVAARLAAL